MGAAITTQISLYKKPNFINSKETIPLDIFLENIKTGKWEDVAHKVRTLKNKKERDELKKQVPSVTLSGKFTQRTDTGLEQHSGFIGVDIDNLLDAEGVKEQLKGDRYVVSAFVSIGGKGLCLLFRINPDRHREAFQGIAEYLFNQYKIICDPTSINPSRARFVSYDPHIYINERAEKFTDYPKPKEVKEPKNLDKVIYTKDDFGEILKQIVDRRLNITQDSYFVWLRLAFAIVDKFGEAGREYFHTISQFSSKYDRAVADKQFDACVKHRAGNRTVHINTLYYYAKQCGVELYTERTKIIAYSAMQGKKGGLDRKTVAKNLKQFEGIEDAEDVIDQVFDSNIALNEDTLIDQLEIWMRQNYQLQRNQITRYIENGGEILQQKDLNTVYIKAKKIFDKVTYELIDRLINSDFVPTYNPLLNFFAEHEKVDPPDNDEDSLIAQLFQSINTPNNEYALYFGRKWIVGVISAIHGKHSPLMLVLTGELINAGKTEFFRRLLPPQLQPYYAESKLDAGKDDEILMTQKIIIMDDEMGGKSKQDERTIKYLTSKDVFSLREPYGRNNVDLKRLAVLCGTSNESELLDPSPNRRIIPVQVNGVNHAAYNAVNKVDLWMEAYSLWKAGFEWQLNREDIAYLAKTTAYFEKTVAEAELIQKFFEPAEEGAVELTATEIKVEIEKHTNQRLSLDRISKGLKKLGFQQKHVRKGSGTARVYLVKNIRGLIEEHRNSEAYNGWGDDEPNPF